MKNRLKNLLFFFCILFVSMGSMLFSQRYRARIIKDNAYLYVLPNDNSQTIIKLPLGAMLYVEDLSGEWVKVKLPPDKNGIETIGYVRTYFVEFDKEARQDETRIAKPEKTAKNENQDLYSQQELTRANANKALGTTLAVGGAVIFVPCIILTFAHQEFNWATLSYQARLPYILGDAIGMGLIITGLAIELSANETIKRLRYKTNGDSKLSLNLTLNKNIIGLSLSIIL